ncbi:uncharacterized protein LOC126267390 isoform X1 [Schistocerca gregaria]|uniref:uncharacterized protein LOC126267390 isoform X1 n=1 Tax=Schistocerca gregaria TaxID=7010 RepID=UPI00211EDCA4|nr:uncharacterized protein LOC126267390 isoform X1 [Schistocerca gregaria]
MPHAASLRRPALLPPLLLLQLALFGALAVADTGEVSRLGDGQEQRQYELTDHQGRNQQEFALEGELLGLKSYVATKQSPVSEGSVRSVSQEPYNAPTWGTNKDVTSSALGSNTAGVRKASNQLTPPPLSLPTGNSSLMATNMTAIKGESYLSTAKPRNRVESEAMNGGAYSVGLAKVTIKQECFERDSKCKTQRRQEGNARYNTTNSAADKQKRALLSRPKAEDISGPGSEPSQKSTELDGTDRSYEVSYDSQEFQETDSDEDGDNDEDAEEETASSENPEDDEEGEDDDDYDGERNDMNSDGELEFPNDGTPEGDDAEELADNAELNKVAEDLLELMVHIAENPTRWQRLASNLKQDGDQNDGYRSLTKRRSLERLKHRHQQREFDWSKLNEYRETSGSQPPDTKERKNRLRQLMKAGVLPEDDHILRPLGKNRSGKGGNGTRNRNKTKTRQRGRGRNRPIRRKLSRKGGASHGRQNSTVSDRATTVVTDAPSDVEVTNTTRKTLHPMHDKEFLEYARQVASRYQTPLTDDVIREKVMQGWKGTPAPEKEKPTYGGKNLGQYDPEAVISRYKYVLTDEAIREKIMQGPRGPSSATRERQRPPLPPPRNITVPPYREPFSFATGEWSGWKNSSHERPQQQQQRERTGAERIMAGRNDSGMVNVSTRGGVQYETGGRSRPLGAGMQLKHDGYSTRDEIWHNFFDRALNNTHVDRGWENEQGVQPKQAVTAGGGGGGVDDNNLPVGPAPQPTPRRLPHFTYHRVTSQPAPRSRHRDAYVAVSVAAPPEGHRQRHKGAGSPLPGAEQGAAPATATAATSTVAASPPATTPAPIDMEALRRVLHMRDPLEEELVEAAVAARQLSRWPTGGGGVGGGGAGGDSGDARMQGGFWQHLGDVLKLQEETKTLAALEAKLHSAREADQDRVRKILAGDVTAADGAVRGM